MKAKKILALLLALALCLSLFAACNGGDSSSSESGDDSSTSTPSEDASEPDEGESEGEVEDSGITFPLDEPVTFTAWKGPPTNNPALGLVDYNDVQNFQYLTEATNVNIEWQIPPSGQERENFNLMVTSGEYPDLIDSMDTYYVGGLDKAISDGVIISLNDYLETYAPDYLEMISSNEDVYRDCLTDEGNHALIWMVNHPDQGPWYGYTVRQDWLDDLGLETPVTYDDWHDMLLAFKNEKGATAPLWLNYRASDMFNIFPAGYGIAALGGGSDAAFYMVDGQVKYGPMEEGYEQYITMLAQWYSEGLLDPDFYTRTTDGMVPDDLAGTGASGAFADIYTLIDTRGQTSVDTTIETVAVPSPVVNEGDQVHMRQYNFTRGNGGMSISTACENPELAIAWCNLGSVQEYSDLCYYGKEGTDYTIDDEGNYILGDIYMNNPDFTPADTLTKYTYRMCGMYRWDRELQFCGPKGVEAINETWVSNADGEYIIPATTLTTEEGNEFARIMGDIDTYAAEQTTKFILGDEPLENFQQFRDTLVSMGIEDAIALQQAALDRYYER